MNVVVKYTVDYLRGIVDSWNRFWFTPVDPATLSVIRIGTGLLLFYTHLVWSLDLEAFFGPDGWLPRELLADAQQDRYMWSYFWLIDSRAVLWTVHTAGLVIFALLTIGHRSRLMSVLAYLIAVSYVNRVVPGAFFGLDKINCMLVLYLILGPSGACYSVDRLLARRRAGGCLPPPAASVGANVALRMIQLHMCVIYLFSALDKLQGAHWWDGTAVWMAVANLEYQSLDMTWLAAWPKLVALLTYLTLFWELFYCVLVWQRRWRPLVLLMALLVHGGIGLSLGMITFALAMLVGNMAFVPATLVRAVVDRIVAPKAGGAGT